MTDLLIIGAGASGLLCGLLARNSGLNVIILDHSPVAGKKILATGNGKCNITNLNMNIDKFYSSDMAFIDNVLDKVNVQKIINQFNEIGVLTRDKNGYMYPYSEQASAVREALVYGCRNITIKSEFNIKRAYKQNHMFVIEGENETLTSEKLLIATGGKSYSKTGSDGSGYKLASYFGHSIVNTVPALTSLICREAFYKKLKGIRVKGKVEMYKSNERIADDYGEIQFTDYGLSGIPIFNISRNASYLIKQRINPKIIIDFMPEYNQEKLKRYLTLLINSNADMKFSEQMSLILNKKLIPILFELSYVSENSKCSEISEDKIINLVKTIKTFESTVANVKGFDFAQVTAGGVSVSEVDSNTMESKIIDNLYFAGEILDVDGICGGYNLHFAWATAMIAAESIISKGK